MMKRFSFLTVVAVATVACCQTAARAQEDKVYGPSGLAESGLISSITPTEIVLNVKGSNKTFDVNTVKRVKFAGEPAELDAARDDIARGNFNQAKAELDKINVTGIRSDPVKEEVSYYKAFVAAKMALSGGGGSLEDTGRALMAFVNNDKHYHYYEAVETVGEVLMAVNKFAEAQAIFEKLGQAPWDAHRMRSKVLIAQSLMAQDNHADALKLYTEIANESASTPEANREKTFAKIGMAACQASSAPDEGIKAIDQLIKISDPRDRVLFGKAYNARGLCNYKKGDFDAATMDYLRTHVLFNADPDTHAEALYYLRDLWQKLNKNSRAGQVANTLNTSYGSSRWSKKKASEE